MCFIEDNLKEFKERKDSWVGIVICNRFVDEDLESGVLLRKEDLEEWVGELFDSMIRNLEHD